MVDNHDSSSLCGIPMNLILYEECNVSGSQIVRTENIVVLLYFIVKGFLYQVKLLVKRV